MVTGSSMTTQGLRTSTLAILLLTLTSRIDGIAISFCSPDLTAGNTQAVYNQFQTNGACRDTCQGSYAYAVLQGPNCWCSDYAPADQVSTYSCNTVCPGWPDDWCGNTANGLYGYYQLDGIAPKGTAGASSASGGSSSTSGPPPSSVSNTPSSSTGHPIAAPWISSTFGGFSSLTMPATVQSSSRTSKSVAAPSAPSNVPDPVASSIKPTTTITHAATPTEVYTSVTTVTGQVRTVLITPTSTPTSDSTLGSGTQINSNGGGGVSTGKVVGIVIGVALGLGLIIGLGVFYWLRRRHRRNLAPSVVDVSSTSGNTGIPSRQVSQLSSAGLLGKAPRIQTSGLPSGSNPRSADTYGSNFDRRSLGTDQRLNPYAIYAHDESRHSNVSLQDNQDYSRQLRVANPDP